MVDNIIAKQKNNIELISKLIGNFENYSKKLDEKIKVNHIFHDFDEHLRKDLTSLVKLSNERYKSVKSGNKVVKIINKQKDRLARLVQSVANDDLYKSEDIYEEKKKLNQLPQKNNDINNIRLKLRDIQPVQGIYQYKPQQGTSSRDLNENQLKSDGDYLSMLAAEKKNVNNIIENYLKILNDLKINPALRDELFKKKFNLFPENLQFLNFKEVQPHSVERKAVHSELIDMQKLLNLAKSKKKAKQLYYENKKKEQNRSKSAEQEGKSHETSFNSVPLKDSTLLFENTAVPQNNPISVIKNGIAKSFNIEDHLKDKNQNISNGIGEVKLPQIEDYQKLIVKVLNAKKLIQMTDANAAKPDKNYQDIKDKRKFRKEDNPNNNFLSEIKKIKRKPLTYIDDYSRRDLINDKLNDLNSFLIEKHVDKHRLNRKIDEYLVHHEKKLADSLQQKQIHYEKELKKKNKVVDEFKRKFITNLNDPSFNLEDEENTTKDVELNEKSSFLRIQKSPSSEHIMENYNTFKYFKENLVDNENDRSSISQNRDPVKFEEKRVPEISVKNSPKFQKFKNFITNNDANKILNVVKNSSSKKQTNIFEKSKKNLRKKFLNKELPVIVNKSKKVEDPKGKNLMYNLNLNTNPNDSIELYDKI